jgi:hypothetical protein
MDIENARRLFALPVNECAFQANRRDEVQTTRLALVQLALAAIQAHTPARNRHILVIASQVCKETASYLWQAREQGLINDLVFSTANIEHGVAMDIATHHGIARWHDLFYIQDMDVELLSDRWIKEIDALLADDGGYQFIYDSLTPVTAYGNQVVPRRPLCCVFAGRCAERYRFPVTLEHLQGELRGRDPSPLQLDRMWHQCALELAREGWEPMSGKREFHTDTGYAFTQLAPMWGLRTTAMPEPLRPYYIHRGYLSPRYGLSDLTYDGRTIGEHLDEMRTRLREVYGVEPV